MKAKIFALVAAFFMLMGGSAWAQSDVKGDVNKDGVVNEQDIAAILAIMARNNGVAEKTKYYWYAGWTEPTAANIATLVNEEYPVSSTNTTKNKAGGSATVITGYTKEKSDSECVEVVPGGFKDWASSKSNNPIPSITIEVGLGTCPLKNSEFKDMWNANYKVLAAIAYMLK